MYDFLMLFLMFWIFSFCGWLIETIGMSFISKKFVSRGFLIGPYCPVYGVGALAMMLFLKKYLDDPITLFFMAVIVTSFVEYMTSYIMEKIFKARWWDYSHAKFNLNGRVCLINSLGFGVLGLLLLYVIEPFLTNLLLNLKPWLMMSISTILLIIFIIDFIVSFNIVLKIKNNTRFIKKDNTEEITKKVRYTLSNQLHLTKRILKAFPKYKPLNSNISITNLRQALERLEIEQKQKKLNLKEKRNNLKINRKKEKLKQKSKEIKRKKAD